MRSGANCANCERGKNTHRVFRILAAGEPGNCRNSRDDRRSSSQRMGDRSMAAQESFRSAETRDPVDIGNQAGDKQHRSRGARNFIQAGAAESDGSQRMRYGFHDVSLRSFFLWTRFVAQALLPVQFSRLLLPRESRVSAAHKIAQARVPVLPRSSRGDTTPDREWRG